jgi:[protein-PII] uridylyltransferase
MASAEPIDEFAAARAALVGDASLHGRAFARAYSEVVDDWVRALLGDEPGVALLAAGALGRRDLAPGSDLDLVLIHDRRRDVGDVAARLWYPIWDSGLPLDHSVRTGREAVSMADQDLKVVLGLLDGRVVGGDPDLGGQVLTTVRERWAANAKRRLGELGELTATRHGQEGDVAYLLEPDLKQSKGGLRDLRVLHAIELSGHAGGVPMTDLDAADDELLTVRVELHRVTGKSTDRLGLELQDAVAQRLGRDADQLMAGVARAGRAVGWASDDGWRRVASWIAGPRGRRGSADRPLGPGLVLRDREVDLTADADLDDPTLVLRAAHEAARLDVPFRRGVLERLTDAAFPTDPWPDAARQALVGLLGTGDPLVATVEALDHNGLMVHVLPEWEAVRSLPQRNALHRFTVDRHLIETVVQAAALTREVSRPDLLLVGAWLHDIGKGFPGDHTDAGVELMGDITRRLGFPPADVDVLVALVRHHLLLASIATSRDLDDPATIQGVADAVGDVTTLELLVALTKADSLATGQGIWTAWKEQLVGMLAARVAARLAGGELAPPDLPALSDEVAAIAAAAGGAVEVTPGEGRVQVVAPDRPGLLAILVGLLAIHGQNVRTVLALNDGSGTAVDAFEIDAVFARSPDWTRFRTDLDACLAGRFPLEERLRERSARYARRPDAARVAGPRVVVHRGASQRATVVEVRASDEVGLLSRVTGALAALELDIVQARAVTLGHEVVDTFYVRAADSHRPVDDRSAEIEARLLAAL